MSSEMDKEAQEKIGAKYCEENDWDYYTPWGRKLGDEFARKILKIMEQLGYRKLPELPDDMEITEFAEVLYNFREAMDIELIKASIQSFLLANHYGKLPEGQPPLIEPEDIDKTTHLYVTIMTLLEAQREADWDWFKGGDNASAR